jgi:hypothetical protein
MKITNAFTNYNFYRKTKTLTGELSLIWFIMFTGLFSACQKETGQNQTIQKQTQQDLSSASPNALNEETPGRPPFNLDVVLRGEAKSLDRKDKKFDDGYEGEGHEDKSFGFLKFRQENDGSRIVNLDIFVRGLEPNHSYQLQRAVDAIIDGNCTSTTWLTLGEGPVAQSIQTDDKGMGKEDLWRSLAAVPPGSTFDIHFQVVEENSTVVVLKSDCYSFTVR